MSHATVLVAVSPQEVKQHGSVEAAVEHNMLPFDENGEWFRDGSRWDWYQIGGRWTGALDGYDPYKDPANQEKCDICNGSGIRPGGLEQWGQAWFDACNGCNGCHGEGKRVKWSLNPHAGDILPAGQVKRLGKFTSAYAFLRERHWYEAERMGFFGMSIYTECERKDMDKPVANPDAWFGKCLHKDEETGARVICWNEPKELWAENFRKRFVDSLPDDTILVNVDYHV